MDINLNMKKRLKVFLDIIRIIKNKNISRYKGTGAKKFILGLEVNERNYFIKLTNNYLFRIFEYAKIKKYIKDNNIVVTLSFFG